MKERKGEVDDQEKKDVAAMKLTSNIGVQIRE